MPVENLECCWEVKGEKGLYLSLPCWKLVTFKDEIMKILMLEIVTLFTLLSTLNGQADVEKRASMYLEECISFTEMVGVSGGIWKDGKTIWEDGKGLRDKENQLTAEESMLHRIASISKPMTAIAILQLWEKGLLNLDDPVIKHLPSFPRKHSAITINHLLNHTSGIKAYRSRSEAFCEVQYNNLGDAIAVFQERSLANEPGEAYQYTTYGYVVLGAVIEAVIGQDYRAYMKQNIWSVAGMKDTDVEIFGQYYSNKSKLYIKTNDGFKQDIQTNLSVKVPGGGIQSTVGDLLKFGQAVIQHKLIKEETFNRMIADEGKKTRGNPYGMGWFLYGKEGDSNGRIIGHSGSQSGTSTQFMIYLDHNMVVATLANTNGAWNSVYSLNSKLAQIIIDSSILASPIRKAVPVDVSVLDRYVGRYDAKDSKSIEIYRKGGSLYSLKEGFDVIKLAATSKTTFFTRAIQLDVEFMTPNGKQAGKMIMTEGENVSEHSRISNKKSIARELYHVMVDQGSAAGIKWFKSKLGAPTYYLDKETMNAVGYDLINAGEIVEALDVFILNNESFPKEKDLIDEDKMISIGGQLLAAEYDKLAFAYYGFNVKANPNSWKAYYGLGEAYQKIGKDKKAIKYLKEALKLNPESEEVKNVLGELE